MRIGARDYSNWQWDRPGGLEVGGRACVNFGAVSGWMVEPSSVTIRTRLAVMRMIWVAGLTTAGWLGLVGSPAANWVVRSV